MFCCSWMRSALAQAERRALTLKRDFEDVSKLIKSETARFDAEKIIEFRQAIERYSRGLAERQKDLVESWKRYVSHLEEMLHGTGATRETTQPTGNGGGPQSSQEVTASA